MVRLCYVCLQCHGQVKSLVGQGQGVKSLCLQAWASAPCTASTRSAPSACPGSAQLLSLGMSCFPCCDLREASAKLICPTRGHPGPRGSGAAKRV